MSVPALADPYRGLDPSDENWLREQTDRINGLFRRTAEDIINIGRIITEVQRKLGHGYYLTWVAAALPFSADTAERFKNVAGAFEGEIPQRAEFDSTALYLLASPAVPPAARELALKLAAEGHRITADAARAIIREVRPGPADPAARPPRSVVTLEVLRLLIPDGQREAHFDLSVRIDPAGDLIVGVGGETGRDLAAVLGQLAERVRHAPPAPTYDPSDPGLIRWADSIAVGIAGEHGYAPGDLRWDDIKGAARLALVECCQKFDPARTLPDSTEEDAFRGWAKQTIRRECVREAIRLRNGGTFHTKRPELAAPAVVGLGTGEGE